MKKRLRTLVIALLLGAVASAVGIVMLLLPYDEFPLVHYVTDLVVHINALDHVSVLGLRQSSFETTPDTDIAIITIDELSIPNPQAGLGQFPFPRAVYGRLLQRLAQAGTKTVAFDIDFLEPSPNPVDDATFAAGMRMLPTVLAFTINTTSRGRIGEDLPTAQLHAVAQSIGFTSVDTPGRYFIGQPVQIDTGKTGVDANQRLLSLSAAAVEAYTGNRIDLSKVPTRDGRLLLIPPSVFTQQMSNAVGQQIEWYSVGFAPVLPFATALTEPISDLRQLVHGRLVYIGATAQALQDFQITARGNTPGLFANARLAEQLLRAHYITAAPAWLNIALIVLFPLLIALAFTYLRPLLGILLSLAGIVVYTYVNLALFVTSTYWLDLVHVVIAMLLATLLVAAFRVLREGAERRMVTSLFGMHVSPAVVKDILKQDDPKSALALKGKRVKTTIFYSDIRGFTAMSETMTPEEIYAQLNEYFEEMCQIIFAYGGYVDKFIGDCVMAVFSAPYQKDDDAANAVKSAVAQQKKIAELSEKWKAMGKREFTVGMGINTGEVVMGNLGSSSRMNYTVIGDNVNVAARLYNVAKGGEIIISESTYAECKEFVVAQELEPVSVKGKSQPIRIYNISDIRAV
ncbi:MAG: adenylate/guanylate cyclase domain-containing protein [Vulcanimicrobiaceae bacterium]